MIRKHDLQLQLYVKSVAEPVEILSQLHGQLGATQFSGYEISPQAFELCLKREKGSTSILYGGLA